MINSTLEKANILIVDDQQSNIDVITGLLDVKGFNNYITTTEPRQAIHMLEKFKPDILLLDLNMPYFTGFQVMAQLKDIIPDNKYFPILVLTADITPESRQKALAEGASDFLTKPFDLIEVDLRIKNLLRTSYLHQQLGDQNLVLEEKVKIRTRELENTNRELIISKEKAEQSDKLKSEFLNQMSHEIRSPMNAVLNFSSLLKEEMSEWLTSDLIEYFDGIDSAGRRLIRTIDLIMNVSEMQIGTYEPLNSDFDLLKEVLQKIIKENAERIESKGLKLKYTSTLPVAIISGDQYSIYQIFVNIIDNSIKYTKEGYIAINISKNENGITVGIEDTGIGISEEFLKKIYDPFKQEERGNTRRFEGNGLGLTLVKKYCDLNKIGLTVESEKNIGTKFNLFFTNLK